MTIQTQVLARKPDEEQEAPLPLLGLLTFFPVGNPLVGMNAVQRQQFFSTILRGMDEQRAAQIARAKQLAASALPAAAVLRRTGQSYAERAEKMAEGQAKEKEEERQKAAASLPSYRKIGLQGTGQHSQEDGSRETGAGPLGFRLQPGLSAAGETSLAKAQGQLSFVLDDYARGDAAKAQAAVSEMSSRLHAQEFKADDLMAVLLLVIEDQIWEGEEGAAGSARHFGGRVAQDGRTAVPERLREAAKESAVVRLASVREMLRYYFEKHPRDYLPALAMALGLTADQEQDAEFLQERLAYELAHIGGFALAQKILAALKRKKKMEKDTEKCLLELGYKYDKKARKLVVGRRTCGSQGEAARMAGLLLSLARK